MKDKALFGLMSGVSLVVATLIAVAVLNTPPAESAASPAKATLAGCVTSHGANEQGYGVASTVRCKTLD